MRLGRGGRKQTRQVAPVGEPEAQYRGRANRFPLVGLFRLRSLACK